MNIRIETDEYDIRKIKSNGDSAKVTMSKKVQGKEYNVIPIPYNDELDVSTEGIIKLKSNVIFNRSVGKRSKINLPKEYILADAIVFPVESSRVYISGEFKNYFIKKAFAADTVSRVDVPSSFGENVYSVFFTQYFNREGENLVDEVLLRPTIDLKRYSSISLPKRYMGHYMVFFEDDYFEF